MSLLMAACAAAAILGASGDRGGLPAAATGARPPGMRDGGMGRMWAGGPGRRPGGPGSRLLAGALGGGGPIAVILPYESWESA